MFTSKESRNMYLKSPNLFVRFYKNVMTVNELALLITKLLSTSKVQSCIEFF